MATEAGMSEELIPLFASAHSVADRDRRVRVRYTQTLKTYAQRGEGDVDQLRWMGRVSNISGNGIGFTLQHRFEPGTFLTLEIENAARTVSHTFQIEVVRILPQPGGWLLGCIFLRELTEDEVQALL